MFSITNPKDIVDNLLTILNAADETKGVEWHKGEPARSKWNKYPFGWVEWDGETIKPKTSVSEKIYPRIFIAVVDRNIHEGKAEDSIMDFAVKVKDAVKITPTLLGSVETSWFTDRDKEKFFEEDHSIVGVGLKLTGYYFE